MKKTFAVLLASVLAASLTGISTQGCGPSNKHYFNVLDKYFSQNGERLSILQFNCVFPASLGATLQDSSVNETRKEFLIQAIRAHITAFERNEGVISLSAGIAVTDSSDIDCGLVHTPPPTNSPPPTNNNGGGIDGNPVDTNGFHVIGCYSDGRIVVWTGGDDIDTVPALYHELCHLNFAPNDVNHLDDRWKLWNARGQAVVQQILANRGR
jgi:hypothetical protein